jgi:transcriptional regulator with GAF, ATPase, and Fis domain
MLLPRVVEIMGAVIAGERADLPQRLCTALNEALDGRGAALALMADSTHHHTLAATDPQSAAVCELEFTLGEGPGLHAVARGRPVQVVDLTGAETERWPLWAAALVDRALPARAVFAFPLQISDTTFGLFELYRDDHGALDELDAAAARIATDIAALTLAQSFDETVGRPQAPRWTKEADLDEVEVDQAIGMAMAQLRAPADTALSVLRGRAFAEGRLLGEVARDVLARKITFGRGEQEQG